MEKSLNLDQSENLATKDPVYILKKLLRLRGIKPSFGVFRARSATNVSGYRSRVFFNNQEVPFKVEGVSRTEEVAKHEAARTLISKLTGVQLAEQVKNDAAGIVQKAPQRQALHPVKTRKVKTPTEPKEQCHRLRQSKSLTTKAPVNILQELLSHRGIKPTYEVVPIKSTGSSSTFRSRICLDNKEIPLRVNHSCRSINEAKNAAARALIDKLTGVQLPKKISRDEQTSPQLDPQPMQPTQPVEKKIVKKADLTEERTHSLDQSDPDPGSMETPVSILEKFLERHGIKPCYDNMPTHCSCPSEMPSFLYKVSFDDSQRTFMAMGSGTSIDEAKNSGARSLLDMIEDLVAPYSYTSDSSSFFQCPSVRQVSDH